VKEPAQIDNAGRNVLSRNLCLGAYKYLM